MPYISKHSLSLNYTITNFKIVKNCIAYVIKNVLMCN